MYDTVGKVIPRASKMCIFITVSDIQKSYSPQSEKDNYAKSGNFDGIFVIFGALMGSVG